MEYTIQLKRKENEPNISDAPHGIHIFRRIFSIYEAIGNGVYVCVFVF